MSKKIKTIFIITTTFSGDFFSAQLIKSLKKREKNLRILGLGGCRMQESGCDILYNTDQWESANGSGLLKKYFLFKRLFHEITVWIKQYKVDAFLFVGCTQFETYVIKKIKSMDIQIFLYLSLKDKNRKKKEMNLLKRSVKKIFVFFEFEKRFYQKHGFKKVFFLGHPLLDHKRKMSSFSRKISQKKRTIALFPGSSIKKLKSYLPLMIDIVNLLPDYNYVIVSANDLSVHLISEILKKKKRNLMIRNDNYQAIQDSDLILTASEMVTIESLFFCKPTILIGKTFPMKRWKLDKIDENKSRSAVNILAKKKIIFELFNADCRRFHIVKTIKLILNDPLIYKKMSLGMRSTLSLLGKSRVHYFIAKHILGYRYRRKQVKANVDSTKTRS